MIELISLKVQCLDGSRKLKANESFKVSTASIANMLVKTGRAKYPEAQDKTRYKRKDLRAEE